MDERYDVDIVRLRDNPSGFVYASYSGGRVLSRLRETGKLVRYRSRGAASDNKVVKDWVAGRAAEHFVYNWLVKRYPGSVISRPDDEYRMSGGDGWFDLLIDDRRLSIKSSQKPKEWGWTFQDVDPLTANGYALLWVKPSQDYKSFYCQVTYFGPGPFVFGEMKYAKQRQNKRAVYIKDNPDIKIIYDNAYLGLKQ